MSLDLTTVLRAVDTWPVEDRIRLMHELRNRLADHDVDLELTDEQKAELDRRIAEDDATPDDVVSWDEVKAQALSRIKR